MKIRRAEVGDEGQLARQMKAVADEGRWLAMESDRTVEDLTTMFRSSLKEGHIIFVLEDGAEFVGGIGVHPTSAKGVSDLGMSILPEYRGEGWGRQLVDVAIEAACAEGIRKIELEVFPDNGRAIALYANSGFEIEGLRRDHYLRLDGSLRSALIMARFL